MVNDHSRLASAVALASRLEKGLFYHYDAVATRREQLLLEVLSPKQSTTYMKWVQNNKERCKLLRSIRCVNGKSVDSVSLNELCDQLDKTLHIKKEG